MAQPLRGSTVTGSGRCTVGRVTAWYEICEWNDQDVRRTLDHVDDLMALWLSGTDANANAQIRDATDTIGAISEQWRTSDEPAELTVTLWRALTAIGAARDDAPHRHSGSVAQINSSTGGVPKAAIPSASIGWRGVDGDVQGTRLHHGRPWQALCLWSADVIEEFAAAGHPVTAGGAGENLTLRGVDWAGLRAGTVLEIGAVRCQLTAPAVPCSKVAPNFVDRDMSLIDHDLHPGASRWYAAVLQPGSITTGDAVIVSPSSD